MAVHESVYGPKASFRDNSAYGRYRGQSGRTDFMSRYLEQFQAAFIAPRESGVIRLRSMGTNCRVCRTRLREVAWIPKPAKRTATRRARQRRCNTSPASAIISCRKRCPAHCRSHGLQFAAAAAERSLRRIDLGHLVHDPARREPAHLDLSHRSLRRSRALREHVQRLDPLRGVKRSATRRRRNARWSPIPIPKKPTDFIEGMVNHGAAMVTSLHQVGMCVHVYAANRSMTERCFYNADGEMLIVPQLGRARFVTELGIVEASPSEIEVIPRGLPFRVELPDGPSRAAIFARTTAWRCGCRSSVFRSAPNGIPANVRDFLSPTVAYEDTAPHHIMPNSRANLWGGGNGSPPLNVVSSNFAVQIRSAPLHGDRQW